jgi:hypothetical protein
VLLNLLLAANEIWKRKYGKLIFKIYLRTLSLAEIAYSQMVEWLTSNDFVNYVAARLPGLLHPYYREILNKTTNIAHLIQYSPWSDRMLTKQLSNRGFICKI